MGEDAAGQALWMAQADRSDSRSRARVRPASQPPNARAKEGDVRVAAELAEGLSLTVCASVRRSSSRLCWVFGNDHCQKGLTSSTIRFDER